MAMVIELTTPALRSPGADDHGQQARYFLLMLHLHHIKGVVPAKLAAGGF